MMKHEFEELAGYEVSFEDYNNIIEPMYMATGMNKREFVKCIDKKRFALRSEKQLEVEMKKEARHLMETCESYTDRESRDRLEKLAKEYAERFCWIYTNVSIHEATTGDWFWNNCPGRGCTFPVSITFWATGDYDHEIKLELLNKDKELKRLAKIA